MLTHLRKGLLLDRDGVINVDRGYVGVRENFEFMPGLFPFLRLAQDAGYRMAVVTNQSGVGRGLYTEGAFHTLTRWMKSELAREGITIDAVYGCYEIKGAELAAYDRDSFWRKPNPGMMLDAIRELNLDPKRSIMIGDKDIDMQAGAAAGIAQLWQIGVAPTPDWAALTDALCALIANR